MYLILRLCIFSLHVIITTCYNWCWLNNELVFVLPGNIWLSSNYDNDNESKFPFYKLSTRVHLYDSVIVDLYTFFQINLYSGYTPLHIASFHGNIAMVRYLLSLGAKVNSKTKVSLETRNSSVFNQQFVSEWLHTAASGCTARTCAYHWTTHQIWSLAEWIDKCKLSNN